MNSDHFMLPSYYASYAHSIGEENFWPSFTDIMMVVVIVFLLSSTAVVVHNWALTQEIQETAALEKQAREEVYDLNLQQALLHLELGEMQERMKEYREMLGTKSQQLEGKEKDLTGALAVLLRQQSELAQIQDEYAGMQMEIKRSQNVSVGREQELLAVQEQLQKMRQENILHEQLYVEVEAQQRQTQTELKALKKEYEVIGEKYAALSKPARSPLGKVSVAVRYSKVDGEPFYMLKLPGAEKFQSAGNEEIHQTLSQFKERHGDKLYVRIVIPENSNLSYQEGWLFSLDILKRYDYYYQ